jgi:hypothetical protein
MSTLGMMSSPSHGTPLNHDHQIVSVGLLGFGVWLSGNVLDDFKALRHRKFNHWRAS